jgi:hypothetical protein
MTGTRPPIIDEEKLQDEPAAAGTDTCYQGSRHGHHSKSRRGTRRSSNQPRPQGKENKDDTQLLDPLASMGGREEEAQAPSTTGSSSLSTTADRERHRSFASLEGDRVLDPLFGAARGRAGRLLAPTAWALDREAPPRTTPDLSPQSRACSGQDAQNSGKDAAEKLPKLRRRLSSATSDRHHRQRSLGLGRQIWISTKVL